MHRLHAFDPAEKHVVARMFVGRGELGSVRPDMNFVVLGERILIMLLNRLVPKHKYVSLASGLPV